MKRFFFWATLYFLPVSGSVIQLAIKDSLIFSYQVYFRIQTRPILSDLFLLSCCLFFSSLFCPEVSFIRLFWLAKVSWPPFFYLYVCPFLSFCLYLVSLSLSIYISLYFRSLSFPVHMYVCLYLPLVSICTCPLSNSPHFCLKYTVSLSMFSFLACLCLLLFLSLPLFVLLVCLAVFLFLSLYFFHLYLTYKVGSLGEYALTSDTLPWLRHSRFTYFVDAIGMLRK